MWIETEDYQRINFRYVRLMNRTDKAIFAKVGSDKVWLVRDASRSMVDYVWWMMWIALGGEGELVRINEYIRVFEEKQEEAEKEQQFDAELSKDDEAVAEANGY